jgi:hypothetical protein
MNATQSVPNASRGPTSVAAPALDIQVALHVRLRDAFELEAQAHERRGHRLSWLRLGTFLAGVVLIASAWSEQSVLWGVLGGLSFAGFVAAVAAHSRSVADQTRALCRREIHARHLARLGMAWTRFESRGETLLPRDHPYAWDIDLVGQGSLFQRIDVTHTLDGAQTLADWLGRAADTETATARQAAVLELRDLVEWRQELEAAAGVKHQHEKLDPRGVSALANVPSLFAARPWLLWFARSMPLITLAVFLAGNWGFAPPALWVLPAVVQAVMLVVMGGAVRHTLDVVAAKAPSLEAYKEMLLLLERAPFESPLLGELKQRVALGDVAPSAHLARLAFWVGLAELRHNFLFHVVVNGLTLWDLHVLYGIERFVHDVGQHANTWFRALGELEALAALATLAHVDPDARAPELADEHAALVAIGLGHPLLSSSDRVLNDVSLRGPGTALVVTGSNMAGKSTLLRAVGHNIALALAGGPVIAQRMVVPFVRLRASMRADDSLEAGSSYFHAELSKLKRVIEDAEVSPPVFFLLDELLRGTNARARHVGAKAVLLHLLERRGTGLCATHDVELAALGQSEPGMIENVHFTDVIIAGEMRFDYKLRPGIVRTSNALRLLAMAGVDVPAHEREALEPVSIRPSDPSALREPSE